MIRTPTYTFLHTALLLSPPGPVSEASGSVTVCVNVTNADSIPNGGATIEVFTAAVGLNQATSNGHFACLK